MRTPDVDKERSEMSLSLTEFLRSYNENLPSAFPCASLPVLKEFQAAHPDLFKTGDWSLDKHRKKVMDWLTLRAYLKEE